MADGLRKPEVLSFDGNVAENWRRFKQEYQIYIDAGYSDKPKKVQAMILLNLAGREAIEKERSFVYKPEIKAENGTVTQEGETGNDPDTLLTKFEEICTRQKNVIMERHAFNTRDQMDEDAQSYIASLRILASSCEFGDLQDELIRDRLVCGLKSNVVRKQLLKEPKLTLQKATQICVLHEVSEAHTEKFQAKSQAAEVHDVCHKRQHKKTQSQHKFSSDEKRSSTSKSGKCKNCGYEHAHKRCPAFNKRCNGCGKWNHFESVCQSKQIHKKNVHDVDLDDDEADTEPYVIDAVNMVDIFFKGEIFATLIVNEQRQDVKIDTGAKCNVMSQAVMQQQKLTSMLNTQRKIQLITYGGAMFETLGTLNVACTHQQKKYDIEFLVTDKKVKTLLGLHDSLHMGLIGLSEHVHEIQPETRLHHEYLNNIQTCSITLSLANYQSYIR